MWFDRTRGAEIMNREIHRAALEAMKEALSVPLCGFKVHVVLYSL